MGPTVTGPGPSAPDRARAFLRAVAWGEHTTIWDLLSDEGRRHALSVATRQGLDPVVAGRLRDDLADPAEREQFLHRLLEGLRRDLRSVDLPNLTVEGGDGAAVTDGGSVAVAVTSPSTIPGTGGWSAGTLVLSLDPVRGWCVDRVEPRLAGP